MSVVVDRPCGSIFSGARTRHKTRALETVVRWGDAALGDLIVSEVLEDVASDKEFRRVKRQFGNFPVYGMVGHHIATQSAVNYRKLRAKGITVRKIVDCWCPFGRRA
jgi:hypothetical protein